VNRKLLVVVIGLISVSVFLLALSACGSPAAGSNLPGNYLTNLPAADAAGRVITLTLVADQSASLTTDYMGKGVVVLTGKWASAGQDVVVTLTRQGATAINQEITFQLQGKDLVTTKWDKNLYGSVGLGTMVRK
jgi:hypothetical protein